MALVKAFLVAVDPVTKQNKDAKIEAHFNPQSLQVTYRIGGPGGALAQSHRENKQGAIEQATGYLAELVVDLLFDTTESGEDVRNTTLKIVAMMKGPEDDKQSQKEATSAPPRELVRFSWGTFLFNGSIQSLSETLDFFSEQGVPLRSTVKLTLNGVELERETPGASSGQGGPGLSASVGSPGGVGFSAGTSLSTGIAVGTTPLTLSQAGDTLQSLASRARTDWKAIASANNIDNPRLVQPGTVLNLNIGVRASS